ncbi:MAG TPA: nuclear transport factor 2 family protein [Steroidobacteraceae bacterium]|nr:nuclear transport factor 2 family protein [Steroidobacteraceae bacterium]
MSVDSYFDAASEYACRRLVNDFAEFIDARQYERLRELFTADAVYTRPTVPDTEIRGIEAIISGFQSRPPTRMTQHLLTNVSIRFTSCDAASGVNRIVLYAGVTTDPELPGKGRKAEPSQLIGLYRDRYVRSTAGWRIAERRGSVLLHT